MELLQGTLDVLILKTLSAGPMHGYAVARWVREVTGDVLAIEEGALYPALHRMERRGWVEAEWGVSESNRRAKYYRLTSEGRAALDEQAATWARYVDAMGRVMAAADSGS